MDPQSSYFWLMSIMKALMMLFAAIITYSLVLQVWQTRAHLLTQLIATLMVLGVCVGFICMLATLPLIVVAKIILIIAMLAVALGSIITLFQVGRWRHTLGKIQQECELASNLVFLQGEMTRAQLEGISARLQQIVQPEERDITESMLKSISPFVMLYFQKEKSILKWGIAAANLGRGIFNSFSKHKN